MDMKEKLYNLGGKIYSSITKEEVAPYKGDNPDASAQPGKPEGEQPNTSADGPVLHPDQNSGEPYGEEGKKKPEKKKIVIAVTIVIIGVLALFMMFSGGLGGTPTITLTDYTSFAMAPNGRNGHGRITMNVDTEALRISMEEALQRAVTQNEAVTVSNAIIVTYSQEESLTNGDVVEITVACDEQKLNGQYPDIAFVGGSGTYTVDGLSDAQFIEPFNTKQITVKFDGYSGAATAVLQMESSDPYMPLMNYSVEPARGLSNGDTVTISIDPNVSRLSEMGYAVPDHSEWTTTQMVSGLDELVSDPATLPASVINSMVNYAESHLASNFNAIKKDELDQVVIEPEISSIYFFDKVDKTSPYTNYFKSLEMTNGVFILGHFFVQDVEVVAPSPNPDGTVGEPGQEVVGSFGGYYVWIFPNVVKTNGGTYTYDQVVEWATQNQTENDCINWAKGEFAGFSVENIGQNTGA